MPQILSLLCLYFVSKWRNEIKQKIFQKNWCVCLMKWWCRKDEFLVCNKNQWCFSETGGWKERKKTIKHFIVWISMSPIVLELFFFSFSVLGWETAVASILRYIFRLNSLNRFYSKTIFPSSEPSSSSQTLFYSYKYYLFWWAHFRRWFVLL